jgi:hypothetical protein
MSLVESSNEKNALPSQQEYKLFVKYGFYVVLHILSISMMFVSYSTEFVGILFTILVNIVTNFFVINDLLVLNNTDIFVIFAFFVVFFLFIGNILVFFFMVRLRNFYLPFINNEDLISNNNYLDNVTKKYIVNYKTLLFESIFILAILTVSFLYHMHFQASNPVKKVPFYDLDIKNAVGNFRQNLLQDDSGTDNKTSKSSLKMVSLILYIFKFGISIFLLYCTLYIVYIGYFFSNRVLTFNHLNTTSPAFDAKSSLDVIKIPLMTAFNNFNLDFATKAHF